MSGASYSCIVCGCYLGRGRARLRAHQEAFPDECLAGLESNVNGLRDRLAEATAALRDLQVAIDSGLAPKEAQDFIQDRRRDRAMKRRAEYEASR